MEATRAFQQYLNTSYPNTQIPAWNHIFSIGEKTHNVAKELGFRAHEYHLASPSNDVGLGGVIRTTLTMDDTLIAPRGNRARIEWSDSLIREGFDVMRPLVYETQDATRLKTVPQNASTSRSFLVRVQWKPGNDFTTISKWRPAL